MSADKRNGTTREGGGVSSNAEQYIDKYKKLERTVRSVYRIREQDSIAYYLSSRNEFQQYRDDIRFCQKVRNFLQHEERIDDSFAIEPNDKMLEFLDALIETIQNRPRCRDICIKRQQMFSCRYGDLVWRTARTMSERGFAHAPVLENGRVKGIFDEKVVFRYLADHPQQPPQDLRVRDLGEYLSLNRQKEGRFIFVKSTLYVEELQLEFEQTYRQGKRIAVAFLTAGGRPDEQVLGRVTPGDILGRGI